MMNSNNRQPFLGSGELLVENLLKMSKSRDKYLQNPKKLKKMCELILNEALKDESTDPIIVALVFDIYNRWRSCTPRQTDLLANIIIKVDYILTPFSGQLNAHQKWDYSKELISSVDNSNYKFTCALIKYGAYHDGKHNSTEITKATLQLQKFLIYVQRNVLRREVDDAILLWTAEVVVYVWKTNNGAMFGEKERGFNRCLFIFMALKAVTLKLGNDPMLENYVRCLQLFFESSPQPFVSTEEIKEFLCHLFGVYMNEELENMSVIYGSLFPCFNTISYSPRSLKHLCRCKIRKMIAFKNATLPSVVQNLEIPHTLNHLLLGGPEFVL